MLPSNKHYEEPPLEEAIFELFATSSAQWTRADATALADLLPRFTGQKEELEDFSLFMTIGPGKAVSQGMQPAPARTRLWTPDATRAVQFSSAMATYNVRKPYGHFEDHLDGIRELFRAYLSVTRPEKLAWVGQRYLNFVRLPLEASPGHYFEVYPRLPDSLPAEHRPFSIQVETAKFEQGNVVINLALMDLSPDTKSATYTIDVYARSTEAVPLELEALVEWQVRAHEYIGASFEMTITDQARKLFKEVPWPR